MVKKNKLSNVYSKGDSPFPRLRRNDVSDDGERFARIYGILLR
jgi:hypothetical protein